MAWLAVNFDGSETVSPSKPERDFREWSCYQKVFVESEVGFECFTLDLPKGSIYKLTGKNMTWNDEPIEI